VLVPTLPATELYHIAVKRNEPRLCTWPNGFAGHLLSAGTECSIEGEVKENRSPVAGIFPASQPPGMSKICFTPFLDGYAYGLEVDDGKRIGHNGATDGFYVAVDYLPKTKSTVLVLSNVSSDGNQRSPGAFAMEVELIESALDRDSILPSEGKELFVADETLRHYIGRYKATDSHNPALFEIRLNGNHLFLQFDGPGSSPAQLRAESKSDFYVADQELEVDFDQSDSALVIDYNCHNSVRFVREKEVNVPRLKP
jgi:hypothetical protein